MTVKFVVYIIGSLEVYMSHMIRFDKILHNTELCDILRIKIENIILIKINKIQ